MPYSVRHISAHYQQFLLHQITLKPLTKERHHQPTLRKGFSYKKGRRFCKIRTYPFTSPCCQNVWMWAASRRACLLQLSGCPTHGAAETITFDPQLQSVASTPRPSPLLLKSPLAKALRYATRTPITWLGTALPAAFVWQFVRSQRWRSAGR